VRSTTASSTVAVALPAEIDGVAVRSWTPVAGGDICRAFRVALADGREVFAKTLAGPPPGFFAAEADGLAWLAEAGAPVPEVLGHGEDWLALVWIEAGRWSAESEEDAGRAVAALHCAGAPTFGHHRDGYVGTVPVDNRPAADWPTFWAERRLRPLARRLADGGQLDPAGADAIDRLCARLPDRADLTGPPEPPARIHGDLWSGNLLAGVDGGAWLVDPSAHGGHRETDLAMLALFGGLSDRFVAAYSEVAPLGDGWRQRLPLHQLHPLLVHALLFGGGYGSRAVAVARTLA
jgi:fructosamine-3-kinase